MAGETVADTAIFAEIAPCFVIEDAARTDVVVLACTHYPLLRDRLERLAPWPVTFIDPAPAIARRVDVVLAALGFAKEEKRDGAGTARFTSGRPPEPFLEATVARFGLALPIA